MLCGAASGFGTCLPIAHGLNRRNADYSLSTSKRSRECRDLSHFRHASAKTLADLECYFFHVAILLDFIAEAFAVKTRLLRGPMPARPRKKPELSPDTKLFPHKNPY
jgi:hypothetical protein